MLKEVFLSRRKMTPDWNMDLHKRLRILDTYNNEDPIQPKINKQIKKRREKSYNHCNRCRKRMKTSNTHSWLKKKTALSRLGMEGDFLNLINDFYKKPNIILNGEGQSTFSPGSGTRQGYLLSLLLFDIALKVLASAIGQQKEKRYSEWKGRSKTIFICR